MKKRIAALFLTICFVALLFPVTASADDGVISVGEGSTVYPIYDTDVVMEEEIIDIVVKEGCSYVNCQFFFHNTGESTDLLVGFPDQSRDAYLPYCDMYDDEDEEFYYDYIKGNCSKLNWFRTYINGKRVPVSIRKSLAPENFETDLFYPKWYIWRIHFSANERIKVVNKYWVDNDIYSNWYGSFSPDGDEISYILRSGATWRGPIGKVTVRMRLEGYDVCGMTFDSINPTYIDEDGTIIWLAENLEPEGDIKVYAIHDGNSHGVGNPFDPETNDSDQSESNKYERMGTRLVNNFYAEYYNGATWWGNKMLRRFDDEQSMGLYYYMGVSYYKMGYTDKATSMFDEIIDKSSIYYFLSAYYKALLCKGSSDSVGYQANLATLSGYEEWFNTYYSTGGGHYIDWIAAWAQSRLADLDAVQ